MKIRSNNPFLVFAKKYGKLDTYFRVNLCQIILAVILGASIITIKYLVLSVYLYILIFQIITPIAYSLVLPAQLDILKIILNLLLFTSMSIIYFMIYAERIMKVIDKIIKPIRNICPEVEIMEED